MTGEPSRQEFERLYTVLDEGFRSVHVQLDAIATRVQDGDIERAVLKQRLTSLEKEVFPVRRSTDAPDANYVPERLGQADASAAKRQGYLIALGLAVLMALLQISELVGGKVIAALSAVGKLK